MLSPETIATLEFSASNKAAQLILPLRANAQGQPIAVAPSSALQQVGAMKLIEASDLVLAVGFANQVNLYRRLSDGMKEWKLFKELVVDDHEEDIKAIDCAVQFFKGLPTLQVSFAGHLGLIYVWQQGFDMTRLFGHFQQVNALKYLPDESQSLLLSASADLTVKIWHTQLVTTSKGTVKKLLLHGLQVVQYLEINQEISQAKVIDWSPNLLYVLSVDSNSTLRVWPFKAHKALYQRLEKVCSKIQAQNEEVVRSFEDEGADVKQQITPSSDLVQLQALTCGTLPKPLDFCTAARFMGESTILLCSPSSGFMLLEYGLDRPSQETQLLFFRPLKTVDAYQGLCRAPPSSFGLAFDSRQQCMAICSRILQENARPEIQVVNLGTDKKRRHLVDKNAHVWQMESVQLQDDSILCVYPVSEDGYIKLTSTELSPEQF